MTDPTQEAVMRAIEARVKEIVNEEAANASKRVGDRVRNLATDVAMHIFSQITWKGTYLTLEVKLPDKLP